MTLLASTLSVIALHSPAHAGVSDGGFTFSSVFDSRQFALQWAYSSSLLSSLSTGTNNTDADAVTVYGSVPPDNTNNTDGLSISGAAYGKNASAPNPWGPEIVFTTPYTYHNGDDLLFTLQHSGAAHALSVDAIHGSTGTANSILAVSDSSAASGTTSVSLPVIEIFTSVPEPSTLAFAATTLLLLKRRRTHIAK